MPTLLISFNNTRGRHRRTGLARMDLNAYTWSLIDLGFDCALASSVGICTTAERVYHLVILDQPDFPTWLVTLDRPTLRPLAREHLTGCVDGHSATVFDESLLVVSTGSDELIAYPFDGNGRTRPQVLWSPTGSGRDTHHINSVTVHRGHLICSAFGPRDDGSWRSAQRGYIYDVSAGQTMVDGLYQPHTVVSAEDTLVWCNSPLGTVDTGDGPTAFMAGYTRGLAFGAGEWFAASSIGRRQSRPRPGEAPVFNNIALGDGEADGRCAVVHFTAEGPRVEVGMAEAADEVYDLALI